MGHKRRAHQRVHCGKLVDVRETWVVDRASVQQEIETRRGRAYQTKCPKCGETVFFLRSANGGRMWFSLLGHGWPKHACFTRGRGYGGPENGTTKDLFSSVGAENDPSSSNGGSMPTYKQIQAHVKAIYDFVPKTCWIADVRASLDLTSRIAPNRKSCTERVYPCPEEKREAIIAALRHFGQIRD